MKSTAKIRTLSFLIVLTVCVILTLFVVEKYFSLLQYKKVTELLGHNRFIQIKNLTPNASPVFTPTPKDILDSFQLELKNYPAVTDSFGFIVSKKNTPDANLRLLFFGGSTTQCLYVDEDKRIPEAVAGFVENKTGLKVNTWNCAAGGTHSYHTLNVLNNMALNLNADYAFFYGNANDLGALMHYGTFFNPNPDKGVFWSIDEYQKRNHVSEEGLLPYTLDAFKTRFNLKPEKDDFGDVRGLKLILDSSVILPHVARVFKTIISNCKANGIEPVLITQKNCFDNLSYEWLLKNMPFFTPNKTEYEQVKRLFHQYNNTLKQIANQEHVMLIDLDDVTMGFDNFYDAIHFNSKGSNAVSKIIAERFVEQLNRKNKIELTEGH